MRRNIAPALVAAGLFLGATGVACDKEDVKDVREVGNDAEREIDQLDGDGKDD